MSEFDSFSISDLIAYAHDLKVCQKNIIALVSASINANLEPTGHVIFIDRKSVEELDTFKHVIEEQDRVIERVKTELRNRGAYNEKVI